MSPAILSAIIVPYCIFFYTGHEANPNFAPGLASWRLYR